jgi:hypothetical protein
MIIRHSLAAVVSLVSFAAVAQEQAPAAAEPREFPATLAEHAVLPAQTFAAAPADAPFMFTVSGRYAGSGEQANVRIDQLYAIPSATSGLARPFPGQPVQGFSGIRSLGDGTFLVLTDNGFGARATSPDTLLMFHHVRPDWENGTVAVLETTFLRDPDGHVPFRIVNESTPERYLTGADFDPESIQPVGDRYWIGDEFGPYLIEIDAEGVVQSFHETLVDGIAYRSPENHNVLMPAGPDMPMPEFNARRSRGYEGMAVSPDGATLYPMLEGSPWVAEEGAYLEIGGKFVLPIFEFDPATGTWGDTVRYYQIEDFGHSLGDFNMIDENRALIIERDGGQGNAAEGWPENPAMFKRIYLVDLSDTTADGVVRKIGYIDLMNIQDPDGVALAGTRDGVFTFPFETIEDVDMVDETHIVVADDNNFPNSTGRAEGVADNNEFILLDVADFLAAE